MLKPLSEHLFSLRTCTNAASYKKARLAIVLLGLILLLPGCKTAEESDVIANVKFDRLFCWGEPKNEQTAARYASAGVTDIAVRNKEQYDLAMKYGMTPYLKTFTPAGPHPQVMTEDETKHFDYINGKDLDRKLPRVERVKLIDRRRIEKQHRYGGEPVTKIDTLNSVTIPCFISDDDFALTRKKIDQFLKDAPPHLAGIFIDYVGYMNHYGCYCKYCLLKYQKYLADRKLKDTPENKTAFYQEKLVEYYNRVIDYIKSSHPNYKMVVHIYPDFRNDPLYGNRTKADYCGQTVSWYFKWDEGKIRKYTEYVLSHAKDYYPTVEGIPFIGINEKENSSLAHKTPAEVEQELRIILASGSRTVMVCNGEAILEAGYYEIFKKYCGREPGESAPKK